MDDEINNVEAQESLEEFDNEMEGYDDDLSNALSKLYDEGVEEVHEDVEEVHEDDSDEEQSEETDGETDGEESKSDEPAQIPEEVQNYINELEVEKSISMQFKYTIAPHFDFLQHFQINPYEHINDLLTMSQTLVAGDNASKADLIANLVHMFQIDVEALDEALFNRFNPKELSTEEKLLQKIDSLEQKISEKQQPVKQSVNTNDAAIQNEIAQFASKHEHFNEVRADMAILINSGRANSLEEAYRLAVKMNDGIQAKINATNQKTTKAAAATKVGSKSKNAPVSSGKSKAVSLEQQLSQLYDELDN